MRYKTVPLSQIQPTEVWDCPIDESLLVCSDKVRDIYDDIVEGIGIKHALQVDEIAYMDRSFRKVFPPLEGKVYYLHDGHHRYAAATLASVENVRVQIRSRDTTLKAKRRLK